jgi:carbonic anhydrase/acetyltransferase-like protein (isoleucine patch superfamily)
MIFQFENKIPQIHETVFVEESAKVIGDVSIGEGSSIWFHCVVRGDVHYIKIGKRTNIQDLTMIHVTTNTHPTEIGDEVTIGHHAVIHGCKISNRCLIGMSSVILDGAHIAAGCMVAAGSLVPPGFQCEEGMLILGSPAKAIKKVGEKEMKMIETGWSHYQELAQKYKTKVKLL